MRNPLITFLCGSVSVEGCRGLYGLFRLQSFQETKLLVLNVKCLSAENVSRHIAPQSKHPTLHSKTPI